jgi:predicted nucleic acid-binding protein
MAAATTKAVFDASVVVRAGLDRSASAREWLGKLHDGRVRVVCPELIYSEIGSAYLRQVRSKRLDLERARASLVVAMGFPFEMRPNRSLCEAAVTIAVSTGLTAYDAHYLALAEAEDAVLVTADRGLAAAASRSVLLE